MPMYYKLKNAPLSMAFQLADGLGAAFDDDPYNGSIMDLASVSFMSQMAKQYPAVSRQIIFDPASQIAPTNYENPTSWNSSGNVTKNWTYSNAADHSNYKLGQAIQSLPLKEGKFYFEIEINNLGTYTPSGGSATDAVVHLFIAPMGWNFGNPFESIFGRAFNLPLTDQPPSQPLKPFGQFLDTSWPGPITLAAGDIIGIAYDTNMFPVTSEGGVFYSHNGTYQSNHDPATSGTPIKLLTSESPYAVQFHPHQFFSGGAGDTITGFDVTIRTGTDVTYSPPTGYIEH